MNSEVLFSIIMPVYNVENYIEESINSILSQSLKDYELILVNDGSTDSSPKICEEFSRNNDNVIVIHKTNGGLSDARNKGLLQAKGKYVIFIDSDDFWDDNSALEKIKSIIDEKNPDVVTWRYKKYFEDTKQYGNSVGCDYTSKEFDAKTLIASQNYNVSAWCKAVRTKIILDNSLHFAYKELSEDIEWSAEILSLTENIVASNLDFYVYRQRSGSISHSISEKNIVDLKKHIVKINELFQSAEGNKKEILSYYLAQEYTNLIVTMSVYANYKEETEWVKQNKYVLNNACSNRSKILKLMINILGVNLSIGIIGLLRKL